jgi:hypothetical protein
MDDHCSLSDLLSEFEEKEALENPSVVVPMTSLRFTADGQLAMPEFGMRDAFEFNDWSKRQLAVLLGVRWDRWFRKLSETEQAAEVNKRLMSGTESLLVRTTRQVPDGSRAQGTVMGLLSEKYTPLADSKVLRLVKLALEEVEPKLRVLRSAVTDRSTSYVVAIGTSFRPGGDHEVGDVWGGITVRNSGVGYAALSVVAHLERLLCKNGLHAPVPDAHLVHRAHRAFGLAKLHELLTERLRALPGKLANAGRALVASRARQVTEPNEAFAAILRAARLPLRLLPELERAYDAEPAIKGSAFGISQAVTRAAQSMSPEIRFELERAAGEYLTQFSRTN